MGDTKHNFFNLRRWGAESTSWAAQSIWADPG